MPNPLSSFGDVAQRSALDQLSPNHQLNATPAAGPAAGAAKPQGGQNPSSDSGRAARNSAAVGPSDARADINASSSPTPVASPAKTCGCPTCDCGCAKRFVPEVPIPPGSWLQHNGYWFQSSHSRDHLAVFNMDPPTYEHVTNATIVSGHTDTLTYLAFPEVIVRSAPWEIRLGGGPVAAGPPVPSGMVFILEAPADSLVSVVHSLLIIPEVLTGTFVADYSRGLPIGSGDTVNFLSNPAPQAALSGFYNFSGLCLFRDHDEQIAAQLIAEYQAEDGGTEVTPVSLGVTVVPVGEENFPHYQAEGRFITLEFAPHTALTIENLSLDIHPRPEFDPNSFGLYQRNSLTYGLAYKGLGSSSSGPHIEYLVKDAFTHDRTFTFTGDGTSQTFQPAQTSYTVSGGTVSGPTVTIEAPSFRVLVDSVQDVGARLEGDLITLSFVPASGAHIEVIADSYTLLQESDDFGVGLDLFTLTSPHNGVFSILEVRQDGANYTESAWVSGNDVRLLYFFREGDSLTWNYEYDRPVGDVFSITKLLIREKNATTGVIRVLETPLPAASAAWSLDHITGHKVSSPKCNAGMLFFDPAAQGYTISSPFGPIWRSRALLTEPFPIHFTMTSWPEDGLSTDLSISDNAPYWSNVEVKRRQNPWLGFSAAGPYGIQANWGRVGGHRGDSQMLVNLWKRDPAIQLWNHFLSLDVRLLAQTTRTDLTLQVSPWGVTDWNHPLDQGSKQNWPPPATRHRDAWIVPVGWVSHDFTLRDETPEHRGFGYEDAGLTINAISCDSGKILAQYTIRCAQASDEYSEYVDPQARLSKEVVDSANAIATMVDKYVNHNPVYYPPASGSNPAPPHLGFIQWVAGGNFNKYPDVRDGSDPWFLFYKILGIGSEVEVNYNYPGIPTLCEAPGSQRQAAQYWNGDHPDQDAPIDHGGGTAFGLDEDNNIYLSLKMPVWVRQMDVFGDPFAPSTPLKQESFTTVLPAYGPTTTVAGPRYISVGKLINRVIGYTQNGGALIPDPPLLPDVTGIASLIEGCMVGQLVEPAGFDEEGRPLYNYPETTIEIFYEYVEPPKAPLSLLNTYTGAGPFEFPTFSTFQTSPMPYQGALVFGSLPTYYKSYYTLERAQNMLVKLHFDGSSIVEKWRKDLTQVIAPQLNLEPYAEQNSNEPFASEIRILAVGRFIVALRSWRDNPLDKTDFHMRLKLEVYPNSDSEPSILHDLTVPETLTNVVDLFSNVEVRWFAADVNKLGHEHVTIQTKNPETGLVHQSTFEFGHLMTDSPTISTALVDPDEPVPTEPKDPASAARTARADNNYYWEDRGAVKRRKIFEP
jgi:hypothetical protein